jgi:hypothetical protein
VIRLCTEEDCPNKHYGHGKCYKHYLKDPEIKAVNADMVKSGKGKLQCSVMENGIQCDHHRIGKKIYCDKHYRRTIRNPDKDPSTTESRESINAKISISNRHPKEKEHIENMRKGQLKSYRDGRISHRLNFKIPQEQKDSQSAKMKGMSPWMMDNTHSDTSKQLISEKKTGSKDSEQTKLNKKKTHNRPDKLEESRLIGIATNADPIKAARHSASLKKIYNTPEGRAIQFERGKKAKNNPIPIATELPIIQILKEAGIRFGHNKHVHMADHKKYGLRPTKNIDFLIKPNKIIEVNGTYDHADNRKYKADDLIRNHGKKVPAKEIWDREKIQLNQIKKNNFRILVIWQNDLEKDHENTKKRILKFAKS